MFLDGEFDSRAVRLLKEINNTNFKLTEERKETQADTKTPCAFLDFR